MKKKILNLATIGLTSALLLSNGISYATPTIQEQSSKISGYAYLDYNSAPNDVKKKIIEARRKIVYGSQSWTVDGKGSKINIVDGSIEKLPEFKDLYPNWNLKDLTDLAEGDGMDNETNQKNNNNISTSKSLESKDYAYMDYHSASDSMKELILKERKKIVFGDQSWTVDGKASKIQADGTIEKLPEFKDLYPDWDLKDLTKTNEIDGGAVTKNVVSTRAANFAGNVQITNTSNSFYSFNAGLEKQTIAWASTLPTGSKINLGFTNDDTKYNEVWIPNLNVNEGVILNQTTGTRYTVRASTYDNLGWAYINVKPR